MSWDIPNRGDWVKSQQDTPDGLYEGLIGKVEVRRSLELTSPRIPRDCFNLFSYPVYEPERRVISWTHIIRDEGKFFSPLLFVKQSFSDIQMDYYTVRLADFGSTEIWSEIRNNWNDEEVVTPMIAGIVNALTISSNKLKLKCDVDPVHMYPSPPYLHLDIDKDELHKIDESIDENRLFRLFSIDPAYGKTEIKFNPFKDYWYNPNDDKQEEINMPTKLGFKDLKLNLPKTYEDCFFVPKPKKIIYNNPCTIVIWEDGTKTICRVQKGQEFSEYYGYLACLAKKIYGTNGGVDRRIKSVREYGKEKKKKPETTDEFVSSDNKEVKV